MQVIQRNRRLTFETYFEISNRESSESGVYPRSFGLDGWVDGSSLWMLLGRRDVGNNQFPFGHFEFKKPVGRIRGNVIWQFSI